MYYIFSTIFKNLGFEFFEIENPHDGADFLLDLGINGFVQAAFPDMKKFYSRKSESLSKFKYSIFQNGETTLIICSKWSNY